jgi:hypothetical protein
VRNHVAAIVDLFSRQVWGWLTWRPRDRHQRIVALVTAK